MNDFCSYTFEWNKIASFSAKQSLFTELLWRLLCKERWLNIPETIQLKMTNSSSSIRDMRSFGLVSLLESPISCAGKHIFSLNEALRKNVLYKKYLCGSNWERMCYITCIAGRNIREDIGYWDFRKCSRSFWRHRWYYLVWWCVLPYRQVINK